MIVEPMTHSLDVYLHAVDFGCHTRPTSAYTCMRTQLKRLGLILAILATPAVAHAASSACDCCPACDGDCPCCD
jgi:hypothetical protein